MTKPFDDANVRYVANRTVCVSLVLGHLLCRLDPLGCRIIF